LKASRKVVGPFFPAHLAIERRAQPPLPLGVIRLANFRAKVQQDIPAGSMARSVKANATLQRPGSRI
jgi:hypothetical protein